MDETYNRYMTERYRQFSANLIEQLRKVYERGEMAAALYGGELEGLVFSQAFANLEGVENMVACTDIGSAQELKRLKEYLGDSLPESWEQDRFERKIMERHDASKM